MKSKIKIKIVVTSPEEVLKARFIPCLCSETQFLFQNAKVLLTRCSGFLGSINYCSFREEQQSCCWKNILNWRSPIRQEKQHYSLRPWMHWNDRLKDHQFSNTGVPAPALSYCNRLACKEERYQGWSNDILMQINFPGCAGCRKRFVQKWKESCCCAVVSLHQVPLENRGVQVAKVKEATSV